jgi:hypothetical protein
MKKTVLALGLVAVFAIPAGAALAVDDTDDTVDPPVTVQEQVREQARLHEPGEYTGEAIQQRNQLRTHIDDPAYAVVRAQSQAAMQNGERGFGGGFGGDGPKAAQGGGQYGMAGEGQGLGLHDGTCRLDES